MNLHDSRQPGDEPRRQVSGNDDPSRSNAHAAESFERATRRAAIRGRLDALAGDEPLLRVDGLVAGYGNVEVVHGVDLRLGRGQALCLIGPNGAGKSTILHSIFGLTDIRGGRIEVGGRNVTRLGPNAKLRDAGIAYVLRDSSVFPDMTVEQNLWLGEQLMGRRIDARHATERVFERYPFLAARRDEPARLLSRGERRLLEIARAIVMRPRLLLVDEPSIGLEPAFVEQIFDMLRDLRDRDGLAIVLVERNAKQRARTRRHRLCRRLRRNRDGRVGQRTAAGPHRRPDVPGWRDRREQADRARRPTARTAAPRELNAARDQIPQVPDGHREADPRGLAHDLLLLALEQTHVDDADDFAGPGIEERAAALAGIGDRVQLVHDERTGLQPADVARVQLRTARTGNRDRRR